MQDLFLQLTVTISFGVIVYILAIAVPRVSEEGEVEEQQSGSTSLDRIDERMDVFKKKLLRKIKIYIMKADNFVSSHLRKGQDDDDLFKR
jgi:hypothetical protein